jgi:hypothetical protein
MNNDKIKQSDKKIASSSGEKTASPPDFAAGKTTQGILKKEYKNIPDKNHKTTFIDIYAKIFASTYKEIRETYKSLVRLSFDKINILKQSGISPAIYRSLRKSFEETAKEFENSSEGSKTREIISQLIEKTKEAQAIRDKLNKIKTEVEQSRQR